MKPVLTRHVDQLLEFECDDAALRLSGDANRSASSHLNDSLVAQDAQGPQHGIGVDTQLGREITGLRDLLARSRLTLGDGSTNLRGHLLVEESRVSAVESR